MWFKNLRIYRLTDTLPCAIEALGEALAGASFVPCGKTDAQRIGWVPPLGANGTELAHSVADFHLVCARTQQKLLPSAAIAEQLAEQVQALETREGRRIGRRERAEIKDELILSLLPRALTRSHHTFAFLAARRELLLIDAAAAKRAEDLLDLLRSSLGQLAVKPLVPRRSPLELMTRWLAGARLPKHFRLGQQCDLRDSLHAANVVRARAQELATAEVRAHLDCGKQVTALGLGWYERLQFVLHEDLSLRALKFGERDARDPAEGAELDEAARFDADFALMSLELDRLCQELIEVFGVAET